MTTTVRNGFADAVAEHIAQTMFPPHRGVIEVLNPHGGEPHVVLFGNDGYRQDDRTTRYVHDVLHELWDRGWHDADLGIDGEGYTWAIVVPIGDDGCDGAVLRIVFRQLMYGHYCRARGVSDTDSFVRARASICDREIIEHTHGEPRTIPGWESIN